MNESSTANSSMEARARAAGVPILDFDIENGSDFREDVFGVFDKARQAGPIIYSTAARGFWVLSDFKVVEEAIKAPAIFSNGVLEVHRSQEHVFPVMIPETLDPPVHHKYRTALAPMFSPRAVAGFEGRFRERTRAYIERVVGAKEVDFMEAIGRPLPADFFLDLFGIPEALHGVVTDALIAMTFTRPDDDPSGKVRAEAAATVAGAIQDLIVTKRKNPGNDVFSAIMQRKVDDRLLSDDELFSVGILLASAGVETTGGALGYIYEFLGSNSGHRCQIVENLHDTSSATEELLRMFPVANSSRAVVQETDFHGVRMLPGDRVVINRIAANRDPSLLERGGEVVLDRKFNNHSTFGDGIHMCLGGHVARREIRILLEEWHKLIPEYHIKLGYVPHSHVGTTISLSSLPLVLG